MEGVTHPALRELMAARGGIGVVCTEFVRITSNPLGAGTVKKHVVRPSQGALSVQVMGNDIAQMADAARIVSEAGADIVDINLGCPAPRAVRKGVGSAMLKDLKLLGAVLKAMRAATELPFSAKIRAGFDDASHVLDVAQVVEDAGADFIAVHPRRRIDFYQGVADWRIIDRLTQELSIPVIGNGDIWYARDALRMQEETGCAGVMLGRPALRNPWIFLQIAALRAGEEPCWPGGADVIAHIHELADCLFAEFPNKNYLGMLKEQMRYIGRAVDDGGAFIKAVCRQETKEGLLGYCDEFFAPLSASQLDLGAESGELERSGSALVA